MIVEAFGPLTDARVWILISFVLFVFVFIRHGLSGFMAKIDGHISSVRDDIERARAIKADAEDLLAEYKEKHANALAKADDIVAEARAQAARMHAKAEADMVDALARKEAQLKERMARIEQAMQDEIRRMVATLAVDTAKQALTSEVDAKAQSALVAQTLEKLPNQLKA